MKPLLLATTLLLCSCVTEDNSTSSTTTPGYSDTLVEVDISRGANSGDMLEIFCPMSVTCDENFDYRAHRFSNDSISIYLSYKPELSLGYSFDTMKELFEYAYLNIFFPHEKTDSSRTYYHTGSIDLLDSPNREGTSLTFTSFDGTLLSGRLTGIITEKTTEIVSNSEGCAADDMLGICYESEDASIPFTVTFTLPVEQ